MFEELKQMKYRVRANLRSVHVVTEWKNGCIYKTKILGLIVCAPDYKLLDTGAVIGSVSTNVSREFLK